LHEACGGFVGLQPGFQRSDGFSIGLFPRRGDFFHHKHMPAHTGLHRAANLAHALAKHGVSQGFGQIRGG
jgi:hypothetical protein